MEVPAKRKRASNLSSDDKLRFVRILQKYGQSILSKATSNSMADIKIKDEAWSKTTDAFNASGGVVRTVESLKKLWSKLKSEAKIYKNQIKSSVTGTGGGPGKFSDDPVLELVSDLTGRASSGIEYILDCDAEDIITCNERDSSADTGLDQQMAGVSTEYSYDIEYLDDDVEYLPSDVETYTNQEDFIANIPSVSVTPAVDKDQIKVDQINRRRPRINIANERTMKIKYQQQMSNRFAAQRFKAEKEKTELIIQQQRQNQELHAIKMENEKLKKEIMLALLQRISDAEISEIAKVLKEA